MTIRFVGTGGAFDVAYGNSAAIVERRDSRWLVDCGATVYSRLRKHDLADSLHGILITHLHDDHIGSLATLLAHQRYVAGKTTPMVVYFPNEAFQQALEQYLSIAMGEVNKYVEWQSVEEEPGLYAIDTTNAHVAGKQSTAYAFLEGAQRIVYSGDLAHPQLLFDWLDQEGWHGATVFHDITFARGNTHHTYYKLLEPYLDRYRIFGYHCDPSHRAEDCQIPLVVRQPGLRLL